jgi:hypothetical protein
MSVINVLCRLLIVSGLLCPCLAGASAVDGASPALTDAAAVTPASDTTDLKFHDFFQMPVGPRGLRPTDKLLQLNGKRVRILGYMVKQEQPYTGLFLLTPLPVTMGDEDEGLADDLPVTTLFVHLEGGERPVAYVPGLLQVSGILRVGSQDEADGRVSSVRLLLDAAATEGFLHQPQVHRASK